MKSQVSLDRDDWVDRTGHGPRDASVLISDSVFQSSHRLQECIVNTKVRTPDPVSKVRTVYRG